MKSYSIYTLRQDRQSSTALYQIFKILLCPLGHRFSALKQWFTPADVPADVTEVDCRVDQWPPGVSVLAKIESSPAHDLFLEDTECIRSKILHLSFLFCRVHIY